jgi:hypothetical protein
MHLGSRYGDLFQLSYITRDMDAAIAHCRSELGLEGFHVSETGAEVLSGGRVQDLRLKAAVLNVGARQIEILEPLSGPIEVYTEAVDLAAHVLNFHHVAIAVRGPFSEFERLLEEVRASGDEIAFLHPVGAQPEPMVAFCYVDTRRRIGHYTEYLWWHERLTGLPAFPEFAARKP